MRAGRVHPPPVAEPQAMRQDSAIGIQGRVLFALIMREMTTRYGRNAGGYVWAVLEPAATIAIMSAVFQAIAQRPAIGTHFPVFFATGYMAFHFYLDISRAVGNAVTANRALLSFPRVTIVDAIVARFVLQFLTSTFVTALILAVLLAVFDEAVIVRYEYIALAIGLASFLGLAMGLFNAVSFAWSPTWETIFGLINRPLFIISGIFFLYEGLPEPVRAVLWWNPLMHVTALMRAGFYPAYEAGFVSPVYVVLCAAVPFLLGVMLMRTLRATLLEG
jgi:capsular polysaccharide transport system permease protein